MDLIEQYKQLHKDKPKYGHSGSWNIPAIIDLAEETQSSSILDYGCGKGNVVRKLNDLGHFTEGYDPAVEEYQNKPVIPYDMVVCIDVLEHIPWADMPHALRDLFSYAEKVVYLAIAIRYDKTNILPDGTNPHKSVFPASKWMKELRGLFGEEWKIILKNHKPNHEVVICATKL
jgi:SAM-dependent methyltransferase